MKLVYLGLAPLLTYAQENSNYYNDYDPANYDGEDYDMNAVQETYSYDSNDDYTSYGPDPIDDFDPSGTEDDLIDNPDDLHLIGEVHFEDDNAGLVSSLGAEASDDGFRSADPDQQMTSVQKYQDLLFRRISNHRKNKKKKVNNKKEMVHKPKWNKKKKKNNKGKLVDPPPVFVVDRAKFSMKNGAISAFENALVVDRGGARGCDRGWQANHKICANSCRVAWLEGNPRKLFKKDAAAFYKENAVHTKCEACAMWSGLVKPKSPSFYQKSISNLKKGAPVYCKAGQGDCDEREQSFAACNGLSVCADDCWSPAANSKSCLNCKRKWCVDQTPGLEYRQQFYTVCNDFMACWKKFHPSKYAKSGSKTQLMGQNCWGKPWNQSEISTNPMDRMSQKDICNKARFQTNSAYPQWHGFFKNCTKAVCSSTNEKYFNEKSCSDLKCIKKCLNSADMSEECLFCKHKIDNLDDCKSWACKKDAFPVKCFNSCQEYQKLRMNGVSTSDPAYVAAREVCKSEGCNRLAVKGCKDCLAKAEAKGNRRYDSMIGSNMWRENFDGWGCPNYCKTKTISDMSVYRGVDVSDPEVAGYQQAFDAMAMGGMDWKHMDSLREWAKHGWKKTEVGGI